MQGIHDQLSLRALGLVPGAYRRAWSGLLVLAIALASFMHLAHSHDADAPSISKHHCTYCSTFDRGGAPPPATPPLRIPVYHAERGYLGDLVCQPDRSWTGRLRSGARLALAVAGL